MAKWYKLSDDQKIYWYCLKNDIENEMYVLFGFDNLNAIRSGTFKKIKTIDNIDLDTDSLWNSSKYLVNT